MNNALGLYKVYFVPCEWQIETVEDNNHTMQNNLFKKLDPVNTVNSQYITKNQPQHISQFSNLFVGHFWILYYEFETEGGPYNLW